VSAPQAVLILAAGHGRRMGGPKALAVARGRTFLEHILARCAEGGAPVTVTVDAAFRERVAALPGTEGVCWVEADGTRPMLASVQAALAAAPFAGGLWVWPVDAPFISAAGWARARAAEAAAPEAVWKLRAGGRTGHPTWFPAWSVPLLRAGSWPDGLRGFLAGHAGSVRRLALEGEVLTDVNTPQALAALELDS